MSERTEIEWRADLKHRAVICVFLRKTARRQSETDCSQRDRISQLKGKCFFHTDLYRKLSSPEIFENHPRSLPLFPRLHFQPKNNVEERFSLQVNIVELRSKLESVRTVALVKGFLAVQITF